MIDLYAFNTSNSENPFDLHRFVGEYSYMGLSSYESNSPSLTAWERWLLDWLSDDQVICLKNDSLTQELSPIEDIDGIKAIVIPISKSKVIVIESRRPIGLDSNLKKSGALIYTVDSSIESGMGAMKVFPEKFDDPRKLQSPLSKGESIQLEGYFIEVIESNESGDLVRVKKQS